MSPLLVLAAAAAVATSATPVSPAPPPSAHEPVRMNDVVVIGTHNSYKQTIPADRMAKLRAYDPKIAQLLDYAHRPLKDQLEAGARQLEIDVYYDPEGGRYANGSTDPQMHTPGFKVEHVPGIDDHSSCKTLVACLTIIKDWSLRHPRHVPILLMFNTKGGKSYIPGVETAQFDETAYDKLDATIRSVLPPAMLVTPDDVQGHYPTLRDAVLAGNWPTLDQARGKFLFALDEHEEEVAIYRGKRKSLEGRVFFVNTDESSPAAAYLTINDPIKQQDRIRRDVKLGFIVRTRADDGTVEARANDYARQKAAFSSGAQYISTDYLWPDPRFHNDYHLELPGHARVICDSTRRPQGCGKALAGQNQ